MWSTLNAPNAVKLLRTAGSDWRSGHVLDQPYRKHLLVPGDLVLHQHISEVICRFQQAFDQHDWAAMRACLDDEVFVDYSSFRGTEPSRVLADEYVEQRRRQLGHLVMQHNHSNLVLSSESDERASVSCNFQIYRFERDGDRYFHSWGTYEFGFVRRPVGWKICSIIQHLLKNEGNPSIHGAL